MIGSIKVVVDSASYLPASIRERYGIAVVPMHVSLDGTGYREFVDLDSATFYRRLQEGAGVATSQPAPGEFADAYAAAAAEGAKAVLSIHIGSALSGAVNSARLGAQMSGVPVHIVDTGQASFIEGLVAWDACEALAQGASLEAAAMAAMDASAYCGNVFIVRGLELLERGGRYQGSRASAAGVPLLALVDGAVRPIGSVETLDDAMAAMTGYLEEHAVPGVRLRIGVANGAADELARQLQARVRGSAVAGVIDELVEYEIGPAVGAHTGPGCTGIVFQSRPA